MQLWLLSPSDQYMPDLGRICEIGIFTWIRKMQKGVHQWNVIVWISADVILLEQHAYIMPGIASGDCLHTMTMQVKHKVTVMSVRCGYSSIASNQLNTAQFFAWRSINCFVQTHQQKFSNKADFLTGNVWFMKNLSHVRWNSETVDVPVVIYLKTSEIMCLQIRIQFILLIKHAGNTGISNSCKRRTCECLQYLWHR